MITVPNQVTIDQVNSFWRAANYLSVCLLYLQKNAALSTPLSLSDVKPFAAGHWGCVPSINFIWANLLWAIRANGTDVRMFLGTGHAGPSWLACSYLEGSLQQYSSVGDDEESISMLSRSFGRTLGYTTELSAQYPGVLWPSGELGYTLGIAHGHAIVTNNCATVVVIGDGELETAPTCAALQALRKKRSCKPITIVVNLNGLRMGGLSEISTWDDTQVLAYFSSLDIVPTFVEGFDVIGLASLLVSSITESADSRPRIILLRTPKAATTPASPDGQKLTGSIDAHKAPLKHISSDRQVKWLEKWLISYEPDTIFINGQLHRRAFGEIVPAADLLIGSVRNRILGTQNQWSFIKNSIPVPSSASKTSIDAFVETLNQCRGSCDERLLLTSPDELASNRLTFLDRSRVEVLEYLSEHQCVSWCIGAAIAGTPAWFTTYDAFASIGLSLISQYLKYLDHACSIGSTMSNRSCNILLTSLAWRNVYSHQDPGFASALLEKQFDAFRCFLPASYDGMCAVVRRCTEELNVVNCVIADKYTNQNQQVSTRLTDNIPYFIYRQYCESPGTRSIVLIVAGDYLLREAGIAAQIAVGICKKISIRLIVLEELTWLYRHSDECVQHRREFCEMVADHDTFLVVTSLYAGTLSATLQTVIPNGIKPLVLGYRSNAKYVTPAGALLESGASWIQLAARLLSHVSDGTTFEDKQSVLSAINDLENIELTLRDWLKHEPEDPDWYWDPEPQNYLAWTMKANS
jgi:xylulose-5-phosphate/fructose-6-phosphate phosphoketolase